MSVENGFETAFYEYAGDIRIELEKVERIMFDPDYTPPMLDYDETEAALGINGAVLGGIEAGGKQFLIVDLTKSPEMSDGLKVILSEPLTATPARFLILDTSFDFDTNKGIIGIVPGEAPVQIGRNYHSDRFEYPMTTSSKHFEVRVNDHGLLEIQNLNPTNRTIVIAGNRIEHQEESVLEDEVKPQVEVGAIKLDLKGDDRYFIDEYGLTFGVFDGAGGHAGGDLAADQAAITCERLSVQRNTSAHTVSAELARSELVQIVEEANNAVIENAPGAITTATVARIVVEANDMTDEVPYVVWVQAGDSRLYIMRRGIAKQITNDEGVGNQLRNFLGDTGYGRGSVMQSGVTPLEAGDFLMLVTDGITGDYGTDLLEEAEISAACRKKNAQQVAEKLLEISRKHDDKTAVVIKYEG